MPNSIQSANILVDEYDAQDDESAEDFTFILHSDGSLKSFSIPQHLMSDIPEEAKMILELFGIDDVQELTNRVLH